jgi:hypothetical protein
MNMYRSKYAMVLLSGMLAGCAVYGPYSKLDDPRPEGKFSMRERSLCETPNDPSSLWCDYPHEVREFIDRRKECDHFRGEPIPAPDDDPHGERRREITSALRKYCSGTDTELARLRDRYRDDADVAKALAEFEHRIEP